MSISENIAKTLRTIKEDRGLSYADFAEELGIPKSSLVEYLGGYGNPRADTMELLAERCGIPIIEMISAPLPGREQAETVLRTAKELSVLPPEKRRIAIQLFLEIAALFAEDCEA